MTGSEKRAKFKSALSEILPTEEFHAYPGPKLLATLHDSVTANDAGATATLTRRIARAVITRSYRHSVSDWEATDEGEGVTSELLPPGLIGGECSSRPYFEILIVSGTPPARWAALAGEWRRLRRPLDSFIYEPVFVGSFEDAFCATMLNPDIAAVVIHEGFPFKSRHDAPILRTLSDEIDKHEPSEILALHLAKVINNVRPELDLYFVSNGHVEELAGNQKGNMLRRVFYAVEELLELHLAILEGVQARYENSVFR